MASPPPLQLQAALEKCQKNLQIVEWRPASIDRVGERARRSMDGAKEDGDGNDVVTRIQSEVSAQ